MILNQRLPLKYVPVLASAELLHLLDGLTAGVTQPLFSADDWALRLGDDPSAQQFINQMRQEWLPLTVPDEFCQQMMDFARGYLEPFAGWPHLWAHTLRVTGTALALAPEAGIEPAHAFLLGMFHDVGKLDELHNGGSHEQIGADVAREQLHTHFNRQIVTLLTNVIAKKSSPLNPYTRLIHDADKLDKIGATGIARRLSTSSGTQFAALALSRVEEDLHDFPDMHFPTSQRLAEGKRAFTEMFLAQFIRPGAADGLV